MPRDTDYPRWRICPSCGLRHGDPANCPDWDTGAWGDQPPPDSYAEWIAEGYPRDDLPGTIRPGCQRSDTINVDVLPRYL